MSFNKVSGLHTDSFINPVDPILNPKWTSSLQATQKKKGKRSSGLFGKKNESKSNPATRPHAAGGRLPPPSYLSNQKAETEYDFPISDDRRPYRKQPASERIPNSHSSRLPLYGYGMPERPRDHGREAMSYEPETSAPSSPFHPAGNRTHERPRRSTEYSQERQDQMYEVDTRSNASPFHPFKSPSPSPYCTPDRRRDHNRDHYEAMYEPEAKTILQNSAPGSPFHPAGSRSPPPYRIPNRRSNHAEEHYEDLYERDGNVTLRNSSPSSPFHPAAYRTLDHRSNHGKEQIEDLYEGDGDVTPRNSSPPSPFHPAASRSPPPQSHRTRDSRRNHHDDEQFEATYEPDGAAPPWYSAPRNPAHGPYYSSSDDDNNSTYLYPEIRTPLRSANSTPFHHNYQIVAAETYEQDKQFEPPQLPDESQSFTMQEIVKMRGLKNYETNKEENRSMNSEAYVSVANYKVRLSVSETVQGIIEKHGDIAASSKLQSMATRSYYLESLAAVVMELKSTVLKDLTKKRVAEMTEVVKDMESVKIDVSWLKTAVAELGEAVEYFGQYELAKVEREECEGDLKARKGELEEMTAELVRREKEIKECREKVTVVAGRLGQLEMTGSKLNKNLNLFQSKVHKFEGQAVLLHF